MVASVRGERIELKFPPEANGTVPEQPWIPLLDVEHVVVDASVRLSSSSIARLLYRGIPIVFLAQGQFPAGIAAPFSRQHLCLVQQLDAVRDPGLRLGWAKAIVDHKIRNMRRVLQRLSSNRGQSTHASSWLGAMANQARAAASMDSLRGIEGAASGRYFECLSEFFPAGVPFERRSRRPPQNAANALLSFLYTLLSSEVALHLRAAGLEVGWGCYHEAENGRPALALDLMEPFRAPVADALALDLLNHGRLTAEDFEPGEEGGIMLKRISRRKVFAAWEERLQRQFLYRATGTRSSLRALMIEQAAGIKKAFQLREAFKPFLMN